MNQDRKIEYSQWWLTCIGRTIIWARLRVFESGVAEVFDCDGQTLVYESEDTARAALMDAEFRSLDGLDHDDAALLGVELEQLQAPQAQSDQNLVAQMIRTLAEPT